MKLSFEVAVGCRPKRPKRTIYLTVDGITFSLDFRKGNRVSIQMKAGEKKYFQFEVGDRFGNKERLQTGFTLQSPSPEIATVSLVTPSTEEITSVGPVGTVPLAFAYGDKTLPIDLVIGIGDIETVDAIEVPSPVA